MLFTKWQPVHSDLKCVNNPLASPYHLEEWQICCLQCSGQLQLWSVCPPHHDVPPPLPHAALCSHTSPVYSGHNLQWVQCVCSGSPLKKLSNGCLNPCQAEFTLIDKHKKIFLHVLWFLNTEKITDSWHPSMMTSSNGNILCVTDLLCGEFTGHLTGEFPTQRPVTWSFDVFFDLRLNKQLSEQSWCWWFEMPLRPLWRHCNDHGKQVPIHPA